MQKAFSNSGAIAIEAQLSKEYLIVKFRRKEKKYVDMLPLQSLTECSLILSHILLTTITKQKN